MKKIIENEQLVKELLRAGVTIRGLRGVWFAAKKGDYRAQRKLAQIISNTPIAYDYITNLSEKYGHTIEVTKRKKLKQVKKPTSWQRAAATVGPEGVRVFGGGLPTLGKKR